MKRNVSGYRYLCLLLWLCGCGASKGEPCCREGSGGSTAAPVGGGAGSAATSGAFGSSGGVTGSGGSIPLEIGGSSLGAASGDGNGGCVRVDVEFERQLPNVMLVVDGSGSMIIPDFDGQTRWQAVIDALVGTSGVVTVLGQEVRFGLAIYQSASSKQECPLLEKMDIALDNRASIAKALERATPQGSTPTGETLSAVWPELSALDAEYVGPKVMLLATDGEPTTCAGASKTSEGRALSISAVTDAYAAGIRTFVVGVGTEIASDHLRELANLGQGFPASDPTDRFYRALAGDALLSALRAVTDAVRTCVFELHGRVESGAAGRGHVLLDGSPLEFESEDGWRLDSASQLALLGSACESVKSSAKQLQIWFPCGEFVPR